MEEDILQEIRDEKLKDIFAFLDQHIPMSLKVLNLMKSFDKGDPTNETDLKVYCPHGEIGSGVVIVTLNYLNKCEYKFIEIYCSEDKVSVLQQALIETKILNWTNLIFEGIIFQLWPTINAVLEIKNVSYYPSKYRCMFLPSELYTSFDQEVEVPDGLSIRPLTSTDATLIDKTWAYHSPTTFDYIHHSIVVFGGLGLVRKQDNQLVSWAVGVRNTIGMVYTMPDHRHRGYAEVVIKSLASKFISENIQPVCLSKHDNTPSIKLFKKLGFVDVGLFYIVDPQ